MKGFNKIIVLTVVLLIAGACNDLLDTTNPNQLTSDKYYETPEQVRSAVFTLYPSMTGLQSYFTQNARGLDTELAEPVDEALKFRNFQTTPIDEMSAGVWEGAYTLIYRANATLVNIDKTDWSSDRQAEKVLPAEASFFRGVAFFYLAHMYGQVPVPLELTEDIKDFFPPKAGSVGEVYDQAIADLKAAKTDLPSTRSMSGLVTKGAAMAYLGKAYLYRAGYLNEDEYYAMAATEFKEIIDSGQYGLVENLQDNFTAANEFNQESIFEISYAYNPGQLEGGEGPEPGEAAPSQTPTAERPYQTIYGIGFPELLPSNWLIQQMTQEQTVNGNPDPRYLETIYFEGGPAIFGIQHQDLGWDGIYCDNGQAMVNSDGSEEIDWPFFRKYVNADMDCPPHLNGSQPENNERLMRYSDVLLMYAESLIMSGGSMSEAAQAVQQVRDRANLANKNYSSQSELMQEIKHQRVMEFAAENMNYFDLIRWGDLGNALQQHGTNAQAANYDPVKHKYFPIPQREVANNRNLEQNDPWK